MTDIKQNKTSNNECDLRQIVLDTETTGLSPAEGHRVIEIGAIELVNRRPSGRRQHFYLNPDRPNEAEAEAVHGLSDEFLAGQQRFHEIKQEFMDFIEGAELIIHNADFDIGFLDHELQLCQARVTRLTDVCTILDTLILARQLHPGQPNSLDALCRRYEVDNSSRQLHGALLDSELLLNVYLAMTGEQKALELGIKGEHTGGASDRVQLLPLAVAVSQQESSQHLARLQRLNGENVSG
jgi:DNA polymerase-3 subunit epsilon